MYRATYINPLKQFGHLELTLIVTDDEGVLPNLRIDKKFPDSVTDEELAQEAQRTAELLWNEHIEQEKAALVEAAVLELGRDRTKELADSEKETIQEVVLQNYDKTFDPKQFDPKIEIHNPPNRHKDM